MHLSDNKEEDEDNEMDLKMLVEQAKKRHRFKSTCGNYIYHIAIIDYLTQFNLGKRMESWYKITWKGRKPELVSCVNPDLYCDRFINFMNKDVIVNESI